MNSKLTYQFFKFLEDKKGEKVPFKVKLLYAPETLTREELNVEGYLRLYDTPITSLPDNLKIGEFLDLESTLITSLPDNLEVGGNLFLMNTSITSLPNDLQVGRYIWISRDMNLKNVPNHLKNKIKLFQVSS